MPPTTSRDFQRAAAQRLNAAETLLREKLTLDCAVPGWLCYRVLVEGPDP